MKVIARPRGYGKSKLILRTAYYNKLPILCAYECQKKYYIMKAK